MRKFIFFLSCFYLFFPAWGYAAGLGKIVLNSVLNEPLYAEINVVGFSNDVSRDDLRVGLASPTAFKQFGIERPSYLTDLEFAVVKDKKNKQLRVVITTDDPLPEPYMTFLIELTWPQGHVYRNYTILLDPPNYIDNSAYATNTTKITYPVRTFSKPLQTHKPKPLKKTKQTKLIKQVKQSRQTTQHTTKHVATSSSTNFYGPVKKSEALWSIAKKIRRSDPKAFDQVTLNQIIVAVAAHNQKAFIRGNINRLRQGKRLRIPTNAEIQLYSASESSQIIREHAQALREKSTVTQLAIRTVAEKTTTPTHKQVKRDVSPAISTPSSAKKTSRPKNVSHQTVKQQVTNSSTRSTPSVPSVLQKSQTTITTRTTSKNNLKNTTAPIKEIKPVTELNTKSLQTGIEKSPWLQLDANNGRTQKVKNTLRKELAVFATAIKTEKNANQALQKKLESVQQRNQKMETELQALQIKMVDLQNTLNQRATDVVRVNTRANARVGGIQAYGYDFVKSNLFVELLLGVVLIGGVIGVGGWYTRKRKYQDYRSYRDYFGTDDNETSAVPSSRRNEKNIQSKQQSSAPLSDSIVKDPLQRARIYFACQRYHEAKHVLEEASAKDPERIELKIMLLEAFSALKDKDCFERCCASLPADLSTTHPDFHETVTTLQRATWLQTDQQSSQETSIDIAEKAVAKKTTAETKTTQKKTAVSQTTREKTGKLRKVLPEKKTTKPATTQPVKNSTLDDIGEGDSVATLLDLARVYIEMNNVESAKDALEQVITQSSDTSQREEATSLLQQLNNKNN